MTVLIRKKDTRKQIEKKLSRFSATSKRTRRKKTFDAMKYVGLLKGVYGNPLDYQKQRRDEWQ